jgi:hypothetical protein
MVDLERLREALLALTPNEFERVVLHGVAALTGLPMRQASSGRQPSGDGGGGPIAVEAKRYRTKAPPARDLLGGLATAVQVNPGLTHWVVATTTALPQQTFEQLEVEAKKCQIRFVALDWPTAGFPPLAAALVEAREEIKAKFPALAEPLFALADHPGFKSQRTEVLQLLAEQPPGLPIYDPTLIHRPGLSPSAVLDARYRIVPLMNREADVDEWLGWARQGNTRVRVLTGPGGMGKTRLLIEVCRELRQSGRQAGLLREGAVFSDTQRLAVQLAKPGDSLIVVDYAEGRRKEIDALCAMLLEYGGFDRTRLVLLAREAGEWLNDLHDKGGPADHILSGGGCADPIRLTPAAPVKRSQRQQDRAVVAGIAADAFATALGLAKTVNSQTVVSRLDLANPEFDRILLLLAEVWRLVNDGKSSDGDRWRAILNRERRYLSVLCSRIEPKAIMRALSWVSANEGAASYREAIDLLKGCDALYGHDMNDVRSLAELFHQLYQGPKWLNPIQPDLLASALMDAYPE